MATCDREEKTFAALELPCEFEGLEGLLAADLEAVVNMLTERAHERLFLTKSEYARLRVTLWNGLAEVVNEAMQPFSVLNR